MPKRKVVELIGRESPTKTELLARFVLGEDGKVYLVARTAETKSMVEEMVEHGIPGPGSVMIGMDEGLLFLQYLPSAFRGSRLWAKPMIEYEGDVNFP